MKTILKLIVVALLANASWHLFSAYSPHYKFKDAAQYAAQFRAMMADEEVQDKIMGLAAQFDIPVTADQVLVTHQGQRTSVKVAYERKIELLPGFSRVWPFAFEVDALNLATIPPSKP